MQTASAVMFLDKHHAMITFFAMATKALFQLMILAFASTGGFIAGKLSSSSAREQASKITTIPHGTADLSAGSFASSVGEGEQRIQQSLDYLIEAFSGKRTEQVLEGLNLDQIKAGLEYLKNNDKNKAESLQLAQKLYAAWAKLDQASAWDAANSESVSMLRIHALSTVAREVAKTNVPEALNLAMSLGMDRARSAAISGIFSEWLKTDTDAAIDYLNQQSDLPIDSYALNGAFYELVKDDPELYINSMLRLSLDFRKPALQVILARWGEQDWNAAKKWAEGIQDPVIRDEALTNLLTTGAFGNEDPMQLLKDAEIITGYEQKRDATRTILSNWVMKDPIAAVEYLVNEGSAIFEENPYFLTNVLIAVTNEEREKVLDLLPEGKGKQEMMNNLVNNMVYKGRFPQVISLLNQMEDSPQRDHNLHALGQQWGKSDPEMAEAWILEQEDSSDRDLAIAGYTSTLVQRDPRTAISWVEKIPDVEIQKTAYRNIYYRWLAQDAVAAKQWLAALPIYEEQQKQEMMKEDRITSRFSTYLPRVSQRR